MIGNNLYKSWLFFVLLCLWSCEKSSLPEDSEGDTIFDIVGLFGNSDFNITAGAETFFLFTEKENQDSLTVFSATFAKTDCIEDCLDTLRFRFFSPVNFLSNQTNVEDFLNSSLIMQGSDIEDTIFTETTSRFVALDASQSIVNFPTPSGSYIFEFPDTTFFNNGQDATVYTTDDFMESTTVTLTVNGNQPPCSSTTTTRIEFNDMDSTICYSNIIVNTPDSILTAEPQAGIPPYSYNWNTGATTQSTTVTGNGDYSVIITDANGCESEANIVLDDAFQPVCQAVMEVNLFSESVTVIDQIISIPSDIFSTIVVEYVDENGTFYSSLLAEQSGTTFFDINNIEPYEATTEGVPTLRFDVDFEVNMGTIGGAVEVFRAEGTLVVRY